MKPPRAQAYGYVVIQFAALAYLLATLPPRPWPLVAWGWLGLGGILGLWAILAMRLGHFNITSIPRAESLVTRGPYRWVRHPMYTALLLFALGLLLADAGLLRILAWAILAGTLVFKLRFEERLLAQRYPGYPDYQARTKRLIPFLF